MNAVSAPGSVVVGIDGSQAALHAVRWAAVEAQNVQCPLSLVHTMEWPLVSFPVAAGLRLTGHNKCTSRAADGCEKLKKQPSSSPGCTDAGASVQR